ncbi:hypothetical protein GCM10023165_55660 [Variovorax defluvii]|uniref:Virulence factor membrane-bound polymerase C-terminal domain-containing protein n=1 Tax=Variovorax defluvii TaxID=913761 RepID=A0ABP8IIB8_9BURK
MGHHLPVRLSGSGHEAFRTQGHLSARDDTVAKVQNSWLFASQVKFAELALTVVNGGNALKMHALAEHLLHFSPEPRVIGKLIESAALSGLEDEAFAQATRFRIAFPREYARWVDNEPMDNHAEWMEPSQLAPGDAAT